MTTPHLVADTGPLVAYLDARDSWHSWALAVFAQAQPPLLTCEPVITEACCLLKRYGGGRGVPRLLAWLQQDWLVAPFSLQQEAPAVARLMRRYQELPMSVADACLVRMTEQDDRRKVITLDSHFRAYRKHGRQVVPLLSPK